MVAVFPVASFAIAARCAAARASRTPARDKRVRDIDASRHTTQHDTTRRAAALGPSLEISQLGFSRGQARPWYSHDGAV